MIARLKLKPGQKGTKKLHAEHGDALVCVRYRYDEASGTRIKTIELIVEKKTWRPPVRKFTDNDLVPVRISFTENGLKELAKARREDGTRRSSCGTSGTGKSRELHWKGI